MDAGHTPMEVYLEGHVIVRQDERKYAGRGDQRTLRAPRLYYNFLTDRFIAYDAEIDMFSPGLLAPMRIKSPKIEQYHELIKQPDGTFKADELAKIRADNAVTTGSRFPNPGYKIWQKSLDLKQYVNPATDPISGQHLTNPGDPDPPKDLIWQMDARQNVYYMGPFPAFYWPRVVADLDDQQPAAPPVLLPHQQLLRAAVADRLERIPIHRRQEARLDRPLEPRPRLSERRTRNSRPWAPSSAGSAATSSRT